LCGNLRARITGHVRSAAASELSGLVLSRTQPRVLWTHNDSGDRASLLAITPNGRVLADLAVTGAEQQDWEDIATAGGQLFVGDIGDNTASRPGVSVYRVPEPRLDAPAQAASVPATRLDLRYPDGARDAEALLRDPSSAALVIVTKSFGGDGGVYVAKSPAAGTTTMLRRAGTLALGAGQAVTAGDVSADGRTVVLRTYDRAYVWRRRGGEPLARVLLRRPCAARANLLREGQGETLALARDGRSFLTVPEGPTPAIRRYEQPGA